MSENKPIQLGLCCLNTILRAQKPPVFASRKMIIRSVEEQGLEVLQEKILQNLRDVLTMMDWNEENGIKVFRLSSELFPHKSNPKVDDYSFEFAKELLNQIGVKSKKYNQRLTFHPGQYNVVGSPNLASFKQTIVDLKYHADVLDLINAGKDSVMVVHGGGVYGDKEATIEPWCKQKQPLPENVRNRYDDLHDHFLVHSHETLVLCHVSSKTLVYEVYNLLLEETFLQDAVNNSMHNDAYQIQRVY